MIQKIGTVAKNLDATKSWEALRHCLICLGFGLECWLQTCNDRSRTIPSEYIYFLNISESLYMVSGWDLSQNTLRFLGVFTSSMASSVSILMLSGFYNTCRTSMSYGKCYRRYDPLPKNDVTFTSKGSCVM